MTMWNSQVTVLFLLWTGTLTRACPGDVLPRNEVLARFKQHVLEGLGLERPPLLSTQAPDGGQVGARGRRLPPRSSRRGRSADQDQPETSQIILFPNSDSSCVSSNPDEPTTTRHFTYYFQPSVGAHEAMVTLAHFWFYAGDRETHNSSAPLFILTSGQKLLQASEGPSDIMSDGWTTYHLGQSVQSAISEGPFVLQVRCPTCQCCANMPDKTPFLHLRVRPGPRGPSHNPRRRAAATIPWSPSTIYLLQRPSRDRPEYSDCHREAVDISFDELGWGSWIVQPKVLTFHYCHGNCSAWDRTTAALGIRQCCGPVPGTMRSLQITTTSDGGHSFKYETLPNIMAEDCTCL